jgi:hypothetical protein
MLGPACWSLTLPLLLGAVQEAPSWKSFTSKEGGFTASFPVMPEEKKQLLKTATGQMDVRVFLAEDKNDISYVVSISDLPAKDYKKGTEEQRLDFAREGALNSSRGKLRSEKKIMLDGYPGRDLIIDAENGSVIRLRLYAVGRRLYQVLAVGPATVATSRDVTFFLDSLRLVK